MIEDKYIIGIAEAVESVRKVQNKIKKADELQEFNLDGYRFSKKDSKEYSPVFLRKG